MLKWIKSLFSKKDKNELIIRQYKEAGLDYGDALSYMAPMGKCIGFDKLEKKFIKCQNRYIEAGFRPVFIHEFIEAGGYGKDIDNLFGIRYNEGDKRVSAEGAESLTTAISNACYQRHLDAFGTNSNLGTLAMNSNKMIVVESDENGVISISEEDIDEETDS